MTAQDGLEVSIRYGLERREVGKHTLEYGFCFLTPQSHFLPSSSRQIRPIRSFTSPFQPIDEVHFTSSEMFSMILPTLEGPFR